MSRKSKPEDVTNPKRRKVGRPGILGENERKEIVALVSIGCSRQVAAEHVGCVRRTVYSTRKRDPEFAARLLKADHACEVRALNMLHTVGKEPRHWRSLTWLLERKFPERYGPQRRGTVSKEQMREIVAEIARILAEEYPGKEDRGRVLRRHAKNLVQAYRRKGDRLMTVSSALSSADHAFRCCNHSIVEEVIASLLELAGSEHDGAADAPPLLEWARTYLPQHFRRPSSAMHRWLEAQFAEAERRRGVKLNVVGPRGGAKSTVGTLAWVLRSAVERREPYIWVVSDTRAQAENHLDNLKAELTDNPQLVDKYPDVAGRGPVWRRGAVELRNGTVIEALGTMQRMRGRRQGEHRPTLIVCDDLQNDGHIESATQRERSSRWFHGTLLKAGSQTTNVVNLATALHRDALALELHRTPGWMSRIFPAIVHWPNDLALWDAWEAIYCDWERPDSRDAARAFYEEHREPMDAGAELLWPEEESLYALMCMRVESGRAAFERGKQGVPANPDLCEWPESYFGDDVWFDAWPQRLVLKTIALDPSKGRDAQHGDYSAFVLLGIDAAGVMYVEADLARRPTPEIVADGIELYRRFRPDAFGMEVNYFQELLGDEFAREFRAHGLPDVAPWTIENQVAKAVRIRRLGPLLSQRRLKFRANSPGTKLLVQQLRDFPTADHDDGPDALEMAVRLATELMQGSDVHEQVR